MAELSLVAVAVLGFLLMYNGMRLRRENARLRRDIEREREAISRMLWPPRR